MCSPLSVILWVCPVMSSLSSVQIPPFLPTPPFYELTREHQVVSPLFFMPVSSEPHLSTCPSSPSVPGSSPKCSLCFCFLSCLLQAMYPPPPPLWTFSSFADYEQEGTHATRCWGASEGRPALISTCFSSFPTFKSQKCFLSWNISCFTLLHTMSLSLPRMSSYPYPILPHNCIQNPFRMLPGKPSCQP